MKDAFNVFDGLRAAIKTLQPIEEVQARNALHAISFNENVQISSAMSTLRAFAKKLDDWEAQHSSNSITTQFWVLS